MARRDPVLSQIIDLAISSGRHFQSKKTGFIHAYEGDEECRDTIPILSNLYFALALISSHSIPKVQEGKFILSRMLQFQNRTDRASLGNFPLYLHEYPISRDRLLAIKCLFPLHWISVRYSSILSSPLKEELEQALVLLRVYIDTNLKGRTLPLWSKYLLGKVQEVSLDETPENIAHALLGLQLERPSALSDLKEILEATFHPHLGRYVGPVLGMYRGGKLVPTLYDYFLSYFVSNIKESLKKPTLPCLQAALIQDIPLSLSFSKCVETPSWKLIKEKNFALFSAHDTRKVPLSICTEEHTFILMMHQGKLVECECEKEGGFCIIEVDANIFHELNANKEGDIIQMWCEREGTALFVENAKATLFSLNDRVELLLPKIKVEFRIEKLQGDGIFVGSIFFQNRPQRKVDSNDREPYDFSLALAPVRGTTSCKLRLSFSITALHPSADLMP
jgi:hypothetical protein